MKILICALIVLLLPCSFFAEQYDTFSPDNAIKISFRLNDVGAAQYKIAYNGNDILMWSGLALNFKNGGLISYSLKITSVEESSIDETYSIIVGKSRYGRNYCNETKIS